MASRTTASLALFLIFNLLFFTLTAAGGGCPSPKPKPKPTPSPSPSTANCVCANVLNGLLNLTVGQPPVEPCCTRIKGLADLEAVASLCTALKANILGNNLNVSISFTLLLNVRRKQVPPGFQ